VRASRCLSEKVPKPRISTRSPRVCAVPIDVKMVSTTRSISLYWRCGCSSAILRTSSDFVKAVPHLAAAFWKRPMFANNSYVIGRSSSLEWANSASLRGTSGNKVCCFRQMGTSIGILPWRSRCRWSVTNAHRAKPPDVFIAIGAIAIANDVVRCSLPAASLRQLSNDPFSRRVCRHPQPHDFDVDGAAGSGGHTAFGKKVSARRTGPSMRC
jgi:hypothetical protein